MISNNNSNIKPIQEATTPPSPPMSRKNSNVERMGVEGWINHLENIIFESGIDIHNHTSKSTHHITDRDELLSFSKDLYKFIDVSKATFGDEPSIVDLCKKLNNLAFNLVFKSPDDNKKESLVIFGSKDENSHLNELPRELVDIIAKNMFEAKLKITLDSFKGIE